MKYSKRIQKRVENYRDLERYEKAVNLSYRFKLEKLKEHGWVKVGETTDGLANEIFENPKVYSTVIFISKDCYGFSTLIFRNPDFWHKSEIVFESILGNLKN